MYYFEWNLWADAIAKGKRKEWKAENSEELGENAFPEKAFGFDYIGYQLPEQPKPIGPYYAYNDRYLEIRGGLMENYRGVITAATLLIWGGGVFLPIKWIIILFSRLMSEYDYKTGENFVGMIFFSSAIVALSYFLIRYGRYISRLEVFTLRHICIRFNRITQQVHVQLPHYAGGELTFRWQDIMVPTVDEVNAPNGRKNMDNLGICNMLLFHPKMTGLPFGFFVGMGKKLMDHQDLLGEWEFIRRYMQDGPEGLPKPKLTSLLPLPTHGLSAQLETLPKLFKSTRDLLMKGVLFTALAPLVLFMALMYWVSELLCWQPRWSKAVRESGLPNKPIAPLTQLSDYSEDIQRRLLDNKDDWRVLSEEEYFEQEKINTKKMKKFMRKQM